MIMPNPDSDLSFNILVLGSELLEILNEDSYDLVDNVMKKFLEKDNRRSPLLFMNTLTYLYVIGLINYEGYKIRAKTRNDNTQLHLF
jgi:hypothetical protein